MADSAVSALTAATVVNDTDVLPFVQSGTSLKVTVARLNRKITNQATSAASPSAATTLLLTGSTLPMPTGVTPNLNTQMQWKIILSKTAAGTAALVFHLRAGTAGSTSDAILHTFTFNASTAAADTGRLDILMNFRSVGSGTLAVAQAAATMTHSLSTTGLVNVPSQTLAVTSSGYDSTVANTIYSISCATGTANLLTFYQVIGEAVNV